jgi:dihydropteroate synthase
MNTIGLQSGASILRVHDVKEAKEVILLIEKMNA